MLANEMFQSVSKGAQNRNRKPDYGILYLATVHNEEFTEFKRSRRTRKSTQKKILGSKEHQLSFTTCISSTNAASESTHREI